MAFNKFFATPFDTLFNYSFTNQCCGAGASHLKVANLRI
jgi:hypothetical protein